MDESRIALQAGFLPYDDGSGFSVTVKIRQHDETSSPQIRIEMVSEIDAYSWPEIVAGIDRLLRAIPSPPSGGGR